MRHRPGTPFCNALLTGCLLVLAGSAAALWMPVALSGALALLAVLRLCWIEDNIRSDLLRATKMPEAYLQTQRLQARWHSMLLGTSPEPITCPRRLASILRMQAFALQILLASGLAATLLHAHSIPALGLLIGGATLVLAFSRVERLALAEAILANGAVLNDEMIEDRGWITRHVINR